MRIAIDVSQAVYGTGVSVYTKNLVKSLLEIDDKNKYILFGMSLRRQADIRNFYNALTEKKNLKTKVLPIPPTFADVLWNRLHFFSVENLVGRVDVFHSSDWAQPPAKAFKVTTIHDLSPLKHPEFTPKKIVDVHRARLAWVRKEVDRVIIPSRSAKQDVVSLAGISADKIRVIPEANDEMYRKSSEAEVYKFKKRFGVNSYLLAVGTNPRKNTPRIIEAFEKLRGVNLKLLIVGDRNGLPKPAGVVYTGWLKDQDLVAAYSGAEALIYPSLDEGFGLPILHGFACEVPVVTSNVSSMPEVAGDAAVLVDPEDVDSISKGIKKAREQRAELIRKGLKRVKEFSWVSTASETLKVYQELQSNNEYGSQ